MKMYRALVVAVLGQDHSQVHLDQKHHKTLVSELRNVLFDLGRSNKETQHDALGVHTSDGFEQLLMATHYYNLYLTCMQHGLKGIALKISVTLIRYAGIIPIDKVFYLAGTIARDQGHDNLAFLLLNRYIDLTEAIDEDSIDNIDNADFADATNIPFPFDLPSKQYLVEEDDREEIRDWVLSTCMDKSIDQQLPGSKLSLGTVYAGLYASDLPTCVVSGTPVQKWELLQVNNSIANKVDWNQFVRKVKLCPWTQVEQNPIY
jgi:intraflagellar transport protein 172